MKRIIFCATAIALMTACGNRQQELVIGEPEYIGEQTIVEVNEPATPNCQPYVVVNNPEVDLAAFPLDEEGYHVIFNGNEKMQGWRGYGKEGIPSRWIVEDGCIKFCGTGLGEGQLAEGGDLIFAHQFQNFILELEWKVSKGGNSGIFYLAKEIAVKEEDGTLRFEPIYLSSPEYQVLDNANHPDAFLGVDGNTLLVAFAVGDTVCLAPALPDITAVGFSACGTVVASGNDDIILDNHRTVLTAQTGGTECNGFCNFQIVVAFADSSHTDTSDISF